MDPRAWKVAIGLIRDPVPRRMVRGAAVDKNSPAVASAVGSGTGAVIRRQLLGCGRGFPLRARVEAAVIPSPVPAASHAACGFPALRAPASVRAEGYEAVPSGAAAARPVSRRPGTR